MEQLLQAKSHKMPQKLPMGSTTDVSKDDTVKLTSWSSDLHNAKDTATQHINSSLAVVSKPQLHATLGMSR